MIWTHQYGIDSIRVGSLALYVDFSETGDYVATCFPFFQQMPIPGNTGNPDNRKSAALEMLRMALREHLNLIGEDET